MYRRMLVPLDGSELAETVLPYAKELAENLDVDTVILHVYRQRHGEHEPMHRAYVERASGKIRRQTRTIQPMEEKLRNAGLSARSEVLMGKTADVIIEIHKE